MLCTEEGDIWSSRYARWRVVFVLKCTTLRVNLNDRYCHLTYKYRSSLKHTLQKKCASELLHTPRESFSSNTVYIPVLLHGMNKHPFQIFLLCIHHQAPTLSISTSTLEIVTKERNKRKAAQERKRYNKNKCKEL